MRRLKSVLDRVGLGRPARVVHRWLRAFLHRSGFTAWNPLVPEEEFIACVDRAIRRLQDAGRPSGTFTYLEFGVSRGTSIACVDQVLRNQRIDDARLVGFDSFQGLPPESAEQGWEPGLYRSTIGATRRHLADRGVNLARVELVKGWFVDTLTPRTRSRLALERADVVMIDCDLYSASLDALTFTEPHIHDRAIVIFDDWGWREDLGEVGQKEAFTEFLQAHPELSAEPLPSYLEQARVFLVSRDVETSRRP